MLSVFGEFRVSTESRRAATPLREASSRTVRAIKPQEHIPLLPLCEVTSVATLIVRSGAEVYAFKKYFLFS